MLLYVDIATCVYMCAKKVVQLYIRERKRKREIGMSIYVVYGIWAGVESKNKRDR